MPLDQALVAKGAPYQPTKVVEQGEATGSNSTTHNEGLIRVGMPTDMIANLKAAVLNVVHARGLQSGTRDASQKATGGEKAARNRAKTVIRRIRNSAKIILRDGPVAGVSLDQFTLGEVGNTTRDVLDYLAKLRPLVEPLDEHFKPKFEGQSAFALINSAIGELPGLAGDQESKHDNAPLDTLALHEAQGRVIDLVERINLYAKIAFEDQPDIRALFSKNVLLRTRGRKAAKSAKAEAKQPAQSDQPGPKTEPNPS